MAGVNAENATEAGATAGTVAGALSGARLLSGVVPIPIVGPVFGAVVAGLSEARSGGVLERRWSRVAGCLCLPSLRPTPKRRRVPPGAISAWR